jgi:hypothetical protein
MRVVPHKQNSAVQGPERVTDEPRQPACRAVETTAPFSAAHPFGDAKQIAGIDPVAAFRGGIGCEKQPARAPLAADEAVEHEASVQAVQQERAGAEIAFRKGPDPHGFAGPDRGVHAGAERLEGDGRALFQQVGDDVAGVGHGGVVSVIGKVAYPMDNTSIVWRMARVVLAVAAVGGAGWAGAATPTATGEAVVAAMTGQADVRVFTGPVHEGRTQVRDLFEGATAGESSRVMTGADGRLCMVCSPGAILCVAPQTEFTVKQLRHTADGLPKREEDLVRRIHLDLHIGRIRIQAGVPIPTLDIQISTPAGRIEANGGSFVVAQDPEGRWTVFCDAYDLRLVGLDGAATEVKAGEAAQFWVNEQGRTDVRKDGVSSDSELHQFELCNAFFEDLEPFIERERRFDRAGLENYLGRPEGLVALDDGALVSDVSPTLRPEVAVDSSPLPAVTPGEDPGGRWSEQRIWTWYESLGTVKGVNYIPRTAVNSVEMWMESTFDPEVIDEELGWAREIGYNNIRVQLQFAVWQDDPEGFLGRLDNMLEIAARHGLRMVPVLFDDLNLADSAPQVEEQPAPIPGEHNARWVPSPGADMVQDRSQWPGLEKYVKDVLGRFKGDDRVLYWDLYNTAGNGGLWEGSLPLLDQSFRWARAVKVSQPLAVAAWKDFGSAMSARKLERSDLITFQSFDNVESIEARLQLLQRYRRPIICSDWLMRQVGNDFEQVLPLFAAQRVGWFNQGLVSGKTHKTIQDARYRVEKNPDVWQQDVLQKDGTPYSEREVELIQGFRFLDAP